MKSSQSQPELFSDQLEAWLRSRRSKTLADLEKVFGDKSYAISFLLLMIFSALPLPTGGITNLFELITILLCAQLIAGLQTPWLPKKWKNMRLGKTLTGKVIPRMMKWIRWFERRSSPRGRWIFKAPLMPRLFGLLVLLFTLGAFVAPPFSGLDTLPALGVVIISLAIILDDLVLLIAGTVVGTVGIGLTVALGSVIIEAYQHFI